MKRILLIFSVILLSVSLQGQMLLRSEGSYTKVSTGGLCGSGTDNYGDTDGTTAFGTGTANYIWLMPITVTNCGTVTSYKVFISGAQNVKCALYDGDGNLVANSDAGQITTTNNIYNTWTPSTPPTVSSATTYFIAILPASNIGLMNSGGTVTAYYMARTYGDGFPATLSATTSTASRDINAYVVVTH